MRIINAIRRWLTKNKIFFETFQYIVVGGIGLYISINTLFFSSGEYKMHKKQNSPSIRIKVEKILDDKKELENTNIIILNDGNRLGNFNCSIVTFLDVINDCARCSKPKEVMVPVYNFYGVPNETQESTGKLCEEYGNHTIAKLNSLRKDIQVKGFSTSSFKISPLSLLKICYTDVDSVAHTSYFEVDEFKANQISDSMYFGICFSVDTVTNYDFTSLNGDHLRDYVYNLENKKQQNR